MRGTVLHWQIATQSICQSCKFGHVSCDESQRKADEVCEDMIDADAPQNEWVNFNFNPNPVTAGLSSGVLIYTRRVPARPCQASHHLSTSSLH
eukprot:scaffold1186_cov117-Skeletonema_dohrnii-CCMP3373.AAC.5